jgi:hypothetical protein
MARILDSARVVCWAALAALACAVLPRAAARAQSAVVAAQPDQGRAELEQMVARLIHRAIPLEYEKKKDWGATKEIAVGMRVEGKPFHYHYTPRTKAVNHGVWKHYRVRIIDPQKDLAVSVTNLRPLAGGRVGCTLQVDANIDVWARAKTYEYGVHLVSLEMEGDARVRLIVDGELGVRLQPTDRLPSVALDPLAKSARLVFDEFHVRRVSEARGPIVQELSGSVRRMLEDELDGPALTAKINKAVEKKRDRLSFSPAELLAGAWRPLAELAEAPAASAAVIPPAAASQE